MKTLGLIGGTTWESTLEYYRLLNEGTRTRLGRAHGASLILFNFDFQELADLQKIDGPDALTERFVKAAEVLCSAGADGLMLCANTTHRYAPAVSEVVKIPIIHLVEATAEAVLAKGLRTVALLGTRYTMNEPFYYERLRDRGIEVLVPNEADQNFIHEAIFEELGQGRFLDGTRTEFLRVISGLSERGAEGVILGCTEFPLLIKPEHTQIPLFDTTQIHVEAALKFALEC